MSRKKYECCEKETNTCSGIGNVLGNCCCDFPTLIILILIILQFNRRRDYFGPVAQAVATDNGDCGTAAPIPQPFFGDMRLIDNSILFIIALYFLACCNPCRK